MQPTARSDLLKTNQPDAITSEDGLPRILAERFQTRAPRRSSANCTKSDRLTEADTSGAQSKNIETLL
jgi:hypothetical protein